MQDVSTRGLVTIIIVAIAVVIGGYFLLSDGGNSGTGAQKSAASPVVEQTPGLNNEQLLGKVEIPDTQRSAVAAHKQDILKRIASSKPLTDAEKQTIGNIMLTEAHVYGFTPEEREAVFAALRR